MPTVAISSDFLKAYSRIPKAQQKKVREFTEKFKPGNILVVPCLMDEIAADAARAAAIIAEEGGLTSQAAIVGVSFGIPVIVGVEGAMDSLADGMVITADTERGLIYKGEIHVR